MPKESAPPASKPLDRFFRDIVENLDECVCIGSLDQNRIDYANPAFKRAFGSVGEIDGWVHPDDRETFREAVGRDGAFDVRAVRLDGAMWPVSVQSLAHPSGIAVVVRESSSERELRLATAVAERQNAIREFEGFTHSVSHDLRGPLRSIMAAAMILREDFAEQIGSEGRDQLDRMGQSAKKMATLIDELLKISRLNRQEMRIEPLDLSGLARDVAVETGKADRFTIEEGLSVEADANLVRLTLTCLFDNALKYVAPGALAHIEFGRDDEGFFVRDDGIGFEPDYAERIFKPFERLVRDADYPGVGVGLTNVQRIVVRHGGRVWVESAPGVGSTFRFTLEP